MEKVIVEVSYTGNNYSAHIPVLTGCVTTGNSLVLPFNWRGELELRCN